MNSVEDRIVQYAKEVIKSNAVLNFRKWWHPDIGTRCCFTIRPKTQYIDIARAETYNI